MVRVLKWEAVAGRPLPKPLLKDDSERFPESVVRAVREWLTKVGPQFDIHKPTPIRIVMGPKCESAEIKYGLDEDANVLPGYGSHVFFPGTIEVLFRDNKRKGPILAKYRYVAGQTAEGRVIVGPELGVIQQGSLVITL